MTALPALQRERFPTTPDAWRVLRLLLAQDGSTTRLCETVAGGPVGLHLLAQRVVEQVPAEVRQVLAGTRFIERLSCLAAHGAVLMDNLSYVALDRLDAGLRREIEAGERPLGHLFAERWVRRDFLAAAPGVYARLWAEVGLADAAASRVYAVHTPAGPAMLIAETFRRGGWLDQR